MGRAKRRDDLDDDCLRRLEKRVGSIEEKVDQLVNHIKSTTRPSYDTTLLSQKLHSSRVQLGLKRRCILQLRAEKVALMKYVKELEGFLHVEKDI